MDIRSHWEYSDFKVVKIRDGARARPAGLFTTLLVSLILGVALPFAGLKIADHYGLDFSRDLYIALLSAVGLNGVLLLLPALLPAAKPREADLQVPYPPASALVICNEESDVGLAQDTIDTLLRLTYPGPFQIIVLHNRENRELVASLERLKPRHRNFHPLPVDGDPTGRENIALGLQAASGEIVALFREGQRPLPGSFARALDWISSGFDAVGGRTLNSVGAPSRLSRLEIVDLASTLLPSDSAVFLLSSVDSLRSGNTYWKMTVAREVVESAPNSGLSRARRGYRAAFGRRLLTWEPAVSDFKSVWKQQANSRRSWQSLPISSSLRRLPGVSLGQRLNMAAATAWRPGYAWLPPMIVVLTAFWSWKLGSIKHFGWFVPLAALILLYLLLEPLLRTCTALISAPGQLRRHRLWFVDYFVSYVVFFGALRNGAERAAELGLIFGPKTREMPRRRVEVSLPTATPAVEAGPEEPEPEEDEEPEDIVAERVLPPPIDLQAVMAGFSRGEETTKAMSDESAAGSFHPAPQLEPPKEVTDASSDGQKVVEAAQQLTEMVAVLVRRLDEQEAERRRLEAKLRGLQQRMPEPSSPESLARVRERPVPDQELSELVELLDSLSRNPGHIVLLANVSQHAKGIAEVVNRYVRIQEELQQQGPGQRANEPVA